MKLNKEWHLSHPMPPHATKEQRLTWHMEHARYCRCREIPESLRREIKKFVTNGKKK